MYFRCFTFFFLSVDVLTSQSTPSRRHHGAPGDAFPGPRAWPITGGSLGEPSSAWAAEETPDATAEASFMVIVQAENF